MFFREFYFRKKDQKPLKTPKKAFLDDFGGFAKSDYFDGFSRSKSQKRAKMPIVLPMNFPKKVIPRPCFGPKFQKNPAMKPVVNP